MPETKPNLIWIFGDQHRAQALGYQGDPNLHTPHIDRLAAEGVTFDAVGGCPLSCPYRGSLLSGQYPHNSVPGHEYQMPPEQPTVATAFKDNGYQTAYFGKWHVDGHHERDLRGAMHIVPPDRRGGFDEWLGYENNNSQWDCWVHGGGEGTGRAAEHYRLPGYETDALTDHLIGYLNQMGAGKASGDQKPFFSVLSVQPPHNPYQAPAEWMARFNAARIRFRPNVPRVKRIREKAARDLAGYYAMIENLDWNLGRVREALKKNGLDEDTHIIFFSDHGDMHGSQGQFLKTSPYEESLRVPFIIGGGVDQYNFQRGRRPNPVNHVDLGPTSLGLCGLETASWMKGTDYSGYRLKGKTVEAPDSAFLQLVIPTGHGNSVDRAWRGLVTVDGWKYAIIEGQPLLMFNLNEDPYEQVNLAFNTGFKTERKRLQDRLARWIEDTGDSFALPTI